MSADQPRMIWATNPCPDWCTRTHSATDAPVNRACGNDPVPPAPMRGVGLSLLGADPGSGAFPPALTKVCVSLEQDPREAEPRVIVSSRETVNEMTLSEARHLAALLGEQIDLAEQAMEEQS